MADDLNTQLERVLTVYSEGLNEKIRKITKESMQKFVKETKTTAPKGKRNGQFRRNISANYSGLNSSVRGLKGQNIRAVWYVKAPDYRLTHLIVHGHATRDGDRTRENPFLENALDRILPEYEQKVQEAISNDN